MQINDDSVFIRKIHHGLQHMGQVLAFCISHGHGLFQRAGVCPEETAQQIFAPVYSHTNQPCFFMFLRIKGFRKKGVFQKHILKHVLCITFIFHIDKADMFYHIRVLPNGLLYI